MGLTGIHENPSFHTKGQQDYENIYEMLQPWKFYMKPKNHLFARENHLPNIHYCVPAMNFQGVSHVPFHNGQWVNAVFFSQGTVMDGNHQCSSRYMRSIKPRSRRHRKLERHWFFQKLDKGANPPVTGDVDHGKLLFTISVCIILKGMFAGCFCGIKVCVIARTSVVSPISSEYYIYTWLQ